MPNKVKLNLEYNPDEVDPQVTIVTYYTVGKNPYVMYSSVSYVVSSDWNSLNAIKVEEAEEEVY